MYFYIGSGHKVTAGCNPAGKNLLKPSSAILLTFRRFLPVGICGGEIFRETLLLGVKTGSYFKFFRI